ncbi:hypothetical protein HD554DRAFT_2059785 [Boletus coccyginus]|nr:hypothetical protein HD554DRAFT_2059785 [Boletus coccyginus]
MVACAMLMVATPLPPSWDQASHGPVLLRTWHVRLSSIITGSRKLGAGPSRRRRLTIATLPIFRVYSTTRMLTAETQKVIPFILGNSCIIRRVSGATNGLWGHRLLELDQNSLSLQSPGAFNAP